MKYQLPKLSFSYNALEPFIDGNTMEIHHSKHHQGYVNKFNNAIEGTEFEDTPIEEILGSASRLPAGIRNNGGGHYNHSLFWHILAPNGKKAPEGNLNEAIENTFGSFESFKEAFSQEAATRFGSGWAWLVVTPEDKKLAVTSTPNQDNPLMDAADVQGIPILGLDVWEHAYYLNYQNRRADYINKFWNVVNWEAVEESYDRVKEAPQESAWRKILRFTNVAIHSQTLIL